MSPIIHLVIGFLGTAWAIAQAGVGDFGLTFWLNATLGPFNTLVGAVGLLSQEK